MLRSGRADGSRACALIAALTASEITLREFLDAVTLLTPEELLVIATVLSGLDDAAGSFREKVARRCCLRWASATRAMS